MTLDKFSELFARLVAILGPLLTVLLVAISLAAVLIFFEMCLRYGHQATEMFLPYVRELLNVLRYEPKKTHPAIRLELRLHYFFGGIFLFCFFTIVLHALIPILPEHTEHIFEVTLISSFIVCVFLSGVSIIAALRLP